ncbi:unnamed protein product [Heterobilharzia americana]|nr:unnamed protein product [Heterobilharzia americana]
MTSTPQVGDVASKQLKPTTTVTRYTNEEVNALTELVVRYRDTWKDKRQLSALVQKHMWMQFSQYLQSKGWPRRHWTRLRRKGQQILRKLETVRSSQQTEKTSNETVCSTSCSVSGNVNGSSDGNQLVGRECGSWMEAGGAYNKDVRQLPQIPQHLTIAYNMQQRNTHAEGSEVTGSMTIVNPVSVSSGVGNGGNTNSFHVDDVRVVNSLNVRCSTAVSGTIDLSVSSDEESPQEMCLRSDHLNVDHVSERWRILTTVIHLIVRGRHLLRC